LEERRAAVRKDVLKELGEEQSWKRAEADLYERAIDEIQDLRREAEAVARASATPAPTLSARPELG
jgi:hypothetical protein